MRFFLHNANIHSHITEDTISMTHQWHYTAAVLAAFMYSKSQLRIDVNFNYTIGLRALNNLDEIDPMS